MEPGDARVYFSRGHLYRKLKRYDEAAQDFERAVELEPSNEEAKLLLAEALTLLIPEKARENPG
jgi:cytochrome c-type biogenesis protein CcmH/NrfG